MPKKTLIATDVAENTVIGAFTYGFGRMVERLFGADADPIAVELLQQTGMDGPLGDLLIANARIVRLIEFKRSLGNVAKEKTKLAALQVGLRRHSDRLEALSKKVHWYVETNFQTVITSIVVPYLELAAPVGDRNLERFTLETAQALAGPSLTEQELSDLSLYLRLLAQWCGSGRVGATTGGLLFTINRQGNPQYFQFRDVRELAMQPHVVLEHRRIIEMEHERLRLEHDRELQLRGPSLTR